MPLPVTMVPATETTAVPLDMMPAVVLYEAVERLTASWEGPPDVSAENPSLFVFGAKVNQLRLERNISEAVRLLQARVTQYHFGAELEKGAFTVFLAVAQHDAADSAGAKITAEQARKTLERVVDADIARTAARRLQQHVRDTPWAPARCVGITEETQDRLT